MARSKGTRPPSDAGAGADMDVGTMMMAAFQAGQQSVGGAYQGMPNDSEIKKWLERFAALLEPLGNLSEPRGELRKPQAAQLADIHASLARVDLSNVESEEGSQTVYRRVVRQQGGAS